MMRGLSEKAVLRLLERPDLVAELEVAEAALDAGDDELADKALRALSDGLARPVDSLSRRSVRRRARSPTEG